MTQTTAISDLQKGSEATKAPLATFSHFMDRFKPQLTLALPKHLTADRMARLALTAFSSSEQLQRCEHRSIAASIMTAGQLGLEPGVNGQGYLIPYGRTCTFVPGWKGLVDLVARSGRGTVFTGVIFRDQDYTFTDGARRDLVIHNETDLDAPEDITHAYAIGWVRDAAMPIIELWRVSKIEKHRDKYNKVGRKHYSYRDWEMYARKVPLLQVIKYMPCSIEISNALAVSHAAESGRGVTIDHGIVIDMESGHPLEIDPDTGEVMEPPHTPQRNAAAEGAGGSSTKDQPATTATASQPEQPGAEQNAPHVDDPPSTSGISITQVEAQLRAAKDTEVLDLAADFIGDVSNEAEKERLTALYQRLRLSMTNVQQRARRTRVAAPE